MNRTQSLATRPTLALAALAALGLATLGLATTGCQHQHLGSTQIGFDASTVRTVDGLETPVKMDFAAPADHEIDLLLHDGTWIRATLIMMEPSSNSNYATLDLVLDFATLTDLRSYRGTSRVVLFEPEEWGEAPKAVHLQPEQSPEDLAMGSGRILGIVHLRRVDS